MAGFLHLTLTTLILLLNFSWKLLFWGKLIFENIEITAKNQLEIENYNTWRNWRLRFF